MWRIIRIFNRVKYILGLKLTITCYDCFRPYGDEYGFPVLLIPDDMWIKISPTKDSGGLLCPSCICKRLYERGIHTQGLFESGPLLDEWYYEYKLKSINYRR